MLISKQRSASFYIDSKNCIELFPVIKYTAFFSGAVKCDLKIPLSNPVILPGVPRMITTVIAFLSNIGFKTYVFSLAGLDMPPNG